MTELLFPHDQIRPIQEEVIQTILKGIATGHSVVIHAPTGLGKTAASLAPALTKAIEENKTIFFLTSRNTQHKIAVETAKAIKQKFKIPLIATDIVGKKWMCLQPGVQQLSAGEFSEYCRALREDKKCSYYEDLKSGEKLSAKAKLAVEELKLASPLHADDIVQKGSEFKLCPYELGMTIAKESRIIITDYYYLFHPTIRENFLKRNDIKLENCILIVDEAHNVPDRIKDLASHRLSTTLLQRAAKEAKQQQDQELFDVTEKLNGVLRDLLPKHHEELEVNREVFIQKVSALYPYTDLIEKCYNISDKIREEKKISALGAIASFLDAWMGEQDGFTRIIARQRKSLGESIALTYRCLDPSIVAKEVIAQSHSTILMSGTLTPPEMYANLLGCEADALVEEYPSPFPQENRLNLIVAKTSTKYTARSSDQFQEIASIVRDIVNATPGNSAIFFPSYYVKEQTERYLHKIEKTVFQERPEMSGQEKDEMIEAFKQYKKTGAALLAVVSGSFGEGIDLPGDELKTVIVVGLPLAKPNLETKALIAYYDKKYKNGWNYGYVYPAFNRIIQNAGRCIRSKTDRGVIVFLDERFTWNQYYNCFPKKWKMKVSMNHYKEQIEKFFKEG